MLILGINAFHGDASAAALRDGQLVAAVEEERFNRVKHWAGLPLEAARFSVQSDKPEHVAISRNPKANLSLKIARVLTSPGDWGRASSRLANSVRISRIREDLAAAKLTDSRTRIHFVEHHRAHLASAFFASPFEEAAVVSIDGFGDFSSVMWGVGRGNHIEVKGAVRYPHSLGLFYTAFTQFLGFPNYGDEYKMMGLSAYGQPRFQKEVAKVVSLDADQIRLNLDYFLHHTHGVDMTWDGGEPRLSNVYSPRLPEVFGEPRRPRTELEQRHRDLAASVQNVLEERYLALLHFIQRQTGLKAVCLAGGVALNCVVNGMIRQKTGFQEVYVQPAANDAGTAIGAALYVQHQILKKPRSFVMDHVYFGPEYSRADMRSVVEGHANRSEPLDTDELVTRTAQEIADGKVVGWFQGRMEFGPRALGNRSILADPRHPDMKDILNKRIKFREPFRPFCPSILAERTGDYFESDYPSPFMVMAYPIRKDRIPELPAVAHADGTGRLQTVTKEANPLYWKLLRAFEQLTGVPVLINTSFNENEPIVNTPSEAMDCFLRTNMDVLVLGPYVLTKAGASELAHQTASANRRP